MLFKNVMHLLASKRDRVYLNSLFKSIMSVKSLASIPQCFTKEIIQRSPGSQDMPADLWFKSPDKLGEVPGYSYSVGKHTFKLDLRDRPRVMGQSQEEAH